MSLQPTGQNFLFVNKDLSSQTLSQSASREKSRILSHVRRNHTTGKQPWKEYTTVLSVLDDSKASSTKRPVLSSDVSNSKFTQNKTYDDDDDDDVQARIAAPWLKTLKHNESVYAYLSYMRPSFNGLSVTDHPRGGADVTIGLHSIKHSTGDNNLQIALPLQYLQPSSAFQNRNSSGHDTERLKTLQAQLGDDLLLYSSIAHGSSSHAWKNGHGGDNYSQFWIFRTLQTLRQRLAKPIITNDAGVVLSVFTLALAALWNATPQLWSNNPHEVDTSQFETCRIHIRAMLTLVERAGGWHKFPSYVLDGMLLADKYAAVYMLRPPLIPLTFDPGDEQLDFPATKIPAQNAIPEIATGFQHLRIDTILVEILRDVGRFYHAAAGIWKPEVNLTPREQNLLFRRFQAIHYKLLLTQSMNPSSELVRLTTLIVLCNSTLYGAGLVFTRIVSQHLHERMTKVLTNADDVDHRVWYWCLCTGATTRLAMDDKKWFANQFLQLIAHASTESASTLPAIRHSMRKYLYIPWLQDAQLEAILQRQRVLVFKPKNSVKS